MKKLVCSLLYLMICVNVYSQENQWKLRTSVKPGIIEIHAKLVWMPDKKQFFIWPSLDHFSKRANLEEHSRYHLFDPKSNKFSSSTTKYLEGYKPNRGGKLAVHYAYSSTKKSMFFFRGGFRKQKPKKVHSWVLNLEKNTWKPNVGILRMSDESKGFNASKWNEGDSVPSLGNLIYSSKNKEFVFFGGSNNWGRVGKEKEMIKTGDWFYDESSNPKEVRRKRIGENDNKIEARKWYPSHCGTWLFQEKTNSWAPIKQPMKNQPSGRILSGTVYASKSNQVVLFGGDTYNKVLNDLWIYDCNKKTWQEKKIENRPPPRAGFGMAYLPAENAIVIIGGYSSVWKPLKDVWFYSIDKNEWKKIDVDLPEKALFCSADVNSESDEIFVATSNPKFGTNKMTNIYSIKLNFKTAPLKIVVSNLSDDDAYHSNYKGWHVPKPSGWLSDKNKPEVGFMDKVKSFPKNIFTQVKQPMVGRSRQWGKYIYNPDTHKAYAWGGGHFGYPGNEVSEYNFETNRWLNSNDRTDYKGHWRIGSAGGSLSPSFQGWARMGVHARKSYALDRRLNLMVNRHGEVYDPIERQYLYCIGGVPGRYGVGDQVAFEGAPHGIYGFHAKGGTGQLYLSDIKNRKWNLVAKGGPKYHHEYAVLCFDPKRNGLHFLTTKLEFWFFNIKDNKWSKVLDFAHKGILLGDMTYIDDMDALCWVNKKNVIFYKIEEKKFYQMPSKGDQLGVFAHLNNSPAYDPKYKALVRLTHKSRAEHILISIFPFDFKNLKLEEIGNK